MGCDASKVLSILQARATEIDDRDGLAASLATTLEEAFSRARRVNVWWVAGDDVEPGPYAGDDAAAEAALRDPTAVRDAIAAARDRAVADVPSPHLETRAPSSRIVVMIRSMGQIVGALDLESPEPDAFDEVDRCILRAVADSFGGLVATR